MPPKTKYEAYVVAVRDVRAFDQGHEANGVVAGAPAVVEAVVGAEGVADADQDGGCALGRALTLEARQAYAIRETA